MVGSSKKKSISMSHVKESKVKKPPAIKKPHSKNKDGSDHKSPTSIFGPHAVTRYLRIPQTGNITGAELTVFLPELLRAPGVLFRFFQNGADAQALARISTWFRTTVKDHHTPATAANAMRHITQPTMRHLVDEDWTETRHKAGYYDKAGQVWDHDNLTFAGVKNYCEDNPKDGRHRRLPIPNVPFASLAVDVVVFPSGDDELDLTRYVKAAVANKGLPLMFPRDYGYLTRLLGGPRTVRPAHRDRELFNRWKQVSWVETPSERQVKAAWNLAHHKFTVAEKTATEEYLRQFDSIVQPALDEIRSPVETPNRSYYRPYVPSANDVRLSLNLLLLGHAMDSLAIRLARALTRMCEDDMGVLYHNCLAAHGIVPSGSCDKYTSHRNIVYRSLEPDRGLHGFILPAANHAMTMSSYLGAHDSNTFANVIGSRPSSPINWHPGYRYSSGVSVDLSMIDPEILKTCNRESAGFIDSKHGLEPSQVGPEDCNFDPVDGAEDAFTQETL